MKLGETIEYESSDNEEIKEQIETKKSQSWQEDHNFQSTNSPFRPAETKVIKPLPTLPDLSKMGNYPIFNHQKETKFWKIYAIIITIIIIVSIGALVYLISEEKLTPTFNSTSQINNNYDFKPTINSPVTAEIKNNYSNNYNINLELSDNLIKRVCNST
jgi:hypothetical protein